MNENKTPTAPREPAPEPTLRRLPWYLAFVSMLRSRNIDHVSSTAISKELNVDASQIAKDLSVLDIKGKTRIGYRVADLEKALAAFLGFTSKHNAIMAGVGLLGSALIADTGLERFGLNIVAGFDINPDIVGTTIKNVPIFHISELAERRAAYNAEIGIVAVPVEQAQQVADTMAAAGVSALWNFTPVRLSAKSDVVIVDTSIYADLALIYNRIDCSRS